MSAEREYFSSIGFEGTAQELYHRLKGRKGREKSEKMDLKKQGSSFEGKADRLAGWEAQIELIGSVFLVFND